LASSSFFLSFSRWREKVPQADEGGIAEGEYVADAPPSPGALRALTSPASERSEKWERGEWVVRPRLL
jgi:hypothetical protein